MKAMFRKNWIHFAVTFEYGIFLLLAAKHLLSFDVRMCPFRNRIFIEFKEHIREMDGFNL